MQYQSIILELMGRIQNLEEEVRELKRQLADMTSGTSQEEILYTNEDVRTGSVVQYQKMTDDMIMACYEGGKKLRDGSNAQDIAENIAEITGMNKNSAVMYLYAVSGMLDGVVYKRAISAKAMKKYFETIYNEYGKAGLQKAIRATRFHTEYRRECGHVVDSIDSICDLYEEKYF